MAQRKSKKPTNFEKCYRILEYLKKHTDSEHRTTQAKLRSVPELQENLPVIQKAIDYRVRCSP